MPDKKATQQPQETIKKKGNNKSFLKMPGGQAVLVCSAILAVFYMPTTIILMVGMLPTFAAMVVNFRRNIAKAYSVAATNFVGCFVFILDLWSSGNNFERSVEIITNPVSIIMMYCAACFGYVLDWSLSGMVASLLQQRAKLRLVSIRQRQQDLVEQWGQKVTGNVALDEDGFPFKK